MKKIAFVTVVALALSLAVIGFSYAGNAKTAIALLGALGGVLAALLALVWWGRTSWDSRLQSKLKEEVRQNRLLIKDVRNKQERNEKRAQKQFAQLSAANQERGPETTDIRQQLTRIESSLGALVAMRVKQPQVEQKPVNDLNRPKAGKGSIQRYSDRVRVSLLNILRQLKRGDSDSVVNEPSPSESVDTYSVVDRASKSEDTSRKLVSGAVKAKAAVGHDSSPRNNVPAVSDFDDAFSTAASRVSDAHGPKNGSPRVMFVSSNGAGLGHLTRLSAIDKHLGVETMFYTMSSAYRMIGKKSTDIVYFPSHGDLGMAGEKWNPLMEAHFSAIVSAFAPDLIVFDGTYVYRGVIRTSRRLSIPLTWVQRGCWKPEVDRKSKQRHAANKFAHAVIIPGDYGCSEQVDVGGELEPYYVAPVTLVRAEECYSREQARELLGLPKSGKLFLIQLGAGNINDVTNLRESAIMAVNKLGSDWLPVVVRNPLSRDAMDSDALSVQAYPLSLYYNAFDAGAFAAGYNTVQEAVEMQLPSVFVPNEFTKTDDQVARTEALNKSGLAFRALDAAELEQSISQLADDDLRARLRMQLSSKRQGNGAEEASKVLRDILDNIGTK